MLRFCFCASWNPEARSKDIGMSKSFTVFLGESGVLTANLYRNPN